MANYPWDGVLELCQVKEECNCTDPVDIQEEILLVTNPKGRALTNIWSKCSEGQKTVSMEKRGAQHVKDT